MSLLLNNKQVNVTLFPDSTSQIWKLDEMDLKSQCAKIIWQFSHEGEIIQLQQLIDLLRVYGVKEIELEMPYLPYARQDKNIDNNSTFALQSFSRIINRMEFESVRAFDVHSDAAKFFINSFQSQDPWQEIGQVVEIVKPDVLCFPDSGAKDRYHKDLSHLNKIHVCCEKARDQLTGYITSYKLIGDVMDKDVLVVDDLCDYGNTFIKLTRELLTAGAKSVNMYVSHGLFSGGIRVLKDAGIKRIFTKDGEVSEVSDIICIEKFTKLPKE